MQCRCIGWRCISWSDSYDCIGPDEELLGTRRGEGPDDGSAGVRAGRGSSWVSMLVLELFMFIVYLSGTTVNLFEISSSTWTIHWFIVKFQVQYGQYIGSDTELSYCIINMFSVFICKPKVTMVTAVLPYVWAWDQERVKDKIFFGFVIFLDDVQINTSSLT